MNRGSRPLTGPAGLLEKQICAEAVRRLKRSASRLTEQVSALKSQVGAPWGKDQKDAALAAMVALGSR